MKSLSLTALFLAFSFSLAFGQEDLLAALEEELDEKPTLVDATFKGTRLINGHTIETRHKKTLDFMISHRFGEINGGAYQLFGLDQANIRLGLSYGITERLSIGVGRNSFQKTYDGYIKYKLLQQKTGKGSMPISVTALTATTINSLRGQPFDSFGDRVAYTTQVLIGRKFSSAFSLQLMPTFIHFNFITAEQPNQDLFALGVGGRIKLSKRVSLNLEYYPRFQDENPNLHNSLAIGFDIETGGHVFQLHFTNSRAMVEKGFIAETNDDFFAGDIRFGFNIVRHFQLGKE